MLEQMRNEKRHLRHLEQKMELADLHAEWEAETRQLMHSVRTDSKPHIFFVPKLHNDASLKKLNASTKVKNLVKLYLIVSIS